MNSVIADMLVGKGVIEFSENRPFVFSSGKESPVYCDTRRILSYPVDRELIVDEFLFKVDLKDVDGIVGVATGGIPLAAIVADIFHLPLLYVRPKAKKHGLEKTIEGEPDMVNKAMLVEDIISTGGSALRCVEELRKEEVECSSCVAILAYNYASAKKKFQDAGVNLEVFCDVPDLIYNASRRGSISKDRSIELIEWCETNF